MVKSTIIVFVPNFKFSAKNTIMLTLLGNKHDRFSFTTWPASLNTLSHHVSTQMS